MKNWKSFLMFLFIAFTISGLAAQDKPVVVVNGYFTNKDSSFVFEYLGKNLIKRVDVILPDSAKKIIGDVGKFGIINFSTYDLNDEKAKFFRNNENILYKEKHVVIVNGIEVKDFDMNSLNPAKIISVEILTPLGSAQKYGEARKGGMISIKVKEE